METALQHIIPTRNTFGIEITRLDMKLLADMLNRKAYKQEELTAYAPGSIPMQLRLKSLQKRITVVLMIVLLCI
jgi:hypothetical protein